jgi:hypothetical protein
MAVQYRDYHSDSFERSPQRLAENDDEDALDELLEALDAMPLDSKNVITRDAFKTLIEQVGTMYEERKHDRDLLAKHSKAISDMNARMEHTDGQVARLLGYSTPPPGISPSIPPPGEPRVVEANDTLGALLEEYTVEESPTGIHNVYKISKSELAIRRFTSLQKQAEERASLKRSKHIRAWAKTHVLKGAGHAVAHAVSLAVGGGVIYLLHLFGKL